MLSERACDIGVAIPTCGLRPELWKTLESVFAACAKSAPGEIIVCVNAGSRSPEVVASIYQRIGDRAKIVISNPERQLSMFENWNFCVSQVSRPFVHLLHDDDMVSPYFYDAIGDLISTESDGSLFTSACLILGDFPRYHSGFKSDGIWKEAADMMKRGSVLFCPSVVFSKEKFPGFETYWLGSADWKAWHDLACKGKVVCTLAPLAYYREHHANATSELQRSGRLILEIEQMLEVLQKDTGLPVDYRFAADASYAGAIKAARLGDRRVAARHLWSAIRRNFRGRLSLVALFNMIMPTAPQRNVGN